MRVLVDTNIWIDHLRKTEPVLVDLLERDQVCVHQSVITELALGNLKNRSVFLKAIERLMIVRNVDDRGVRHLVEERRLWGRGLSAVDVALLASARVSFEAMAGSREGVARLCCCGVIGGEVSSRCPHMCLFDKNDGVPVNRL